MPLYMLDTDISSYVMRRSHPRLLERVRQTRMADACISVVTQGELLFGVAVSPRSVRDREALRDYLRNVEIMELDERVAVHYGDIRAGLKTRGQLIGANDLWIAAHARSMGLTLVTNNLREFTRVEGLKIENWASGDVN